MPMQSENRIFDDLARLAGGAVDALAAIRQEIETRVRAQLESMLGRMDLVTREEFEVAREVAAAARAGEEAHAARVATHEARVAAREGRSGSTGPPGK
jgi:BMFP domain-containing protein YqiC